MIPAIIAIICGVLALIGIGMGRTAGKAGDAAKAKQARTLTTVGAIIGAVGVVWLFFAQ